MSFSVMGPGWGRSSSAKGMSQRLGEPGYKDKFDLSCVVGGGSSPHVPYELPPVHGMVSFLQKGAPLLLILYWSKRTDTGVHSGRPTFGLRLHGLTSAFPFVQGTGP